jgi:hypothetical protein
LHAIYPSGRHLSTKARTFIDFLVDSWRKDPDWVAYPLAVVRERPLHSIRGERHD